MKRLANVSMCRGHEKKGWAAISVLTNFSRTHEDRGHHEYSSMREMHVAVCIVVGTFTVTGSFFVLQWKFLLVGDPRSHCHEGVGRSQFVVRHFY